MKQLLEMWNGGKKAFLSALFGALLGTVPAAMVVGQYKQKVDTIEMTLHEHIAKFTPEIVSEFNAEKTKIAVLQEQIATLQKSLDKIDRQTELTLQLIKNK